MMHDEMVVPIDHQGIFGDTYGGVPNPRIPHEHPYPTRFHGPIYSYPRFYQPYRQQSFMVPGGYVGTSGLGADTPALLGSATGSVLLDAVIGAGIGFAMAERKQDRLLWAGGGAVAALLAGTVGLMGVVGVGMYVRK